MSNVEDHVSKALALEKAVYVQEKLRKEYIHILSHHMNFKETFSLKFPKKPQLRIVHREPVYRKNVKRDDYSVKKPTPPLKPKEKPLEDYKDFKPAIYSLLGSALCFFSIPFQGFMGLFLGIVFLLLAIWNFISLHLEKKKSSDDYEWYKNKYDEDIKKYNEQLAEAAHRYESELKKQEEIYQQESRRSELKYKRETAKATAEYEEALVDYNKQLENYKSKLKKIEGNISFYEELVDEQNALLRKLQKTLEEHYSANIIYPKYRYFVAVASICEYLSSGRCDTLEGANGAYNIYETELRQNLIVNQLSAISGNADQIKANQYLLYQELMDAKNTVRKLSESRKQIPPGKEDPMFKVYLSSLRDLTSPPTDSSSDGNVEDSPE